MSTIALAKDMDRDTAVAGGGNTGTRRYARLPRPDLTFTDEVLPGDGGFFDPNRDQHPAVDEIRVSASKRMRASAGIFAGTEGAVVVNITAGAWATWPTGRCGEHRVRFYLDFPDGAQLNDVSIPAGRVYFDTARAPGAEVAAPEPPLPASRPARRPLPPQDLC